MLKSALLTIGAFAIVAPAAAQSTIDPQPAPATTAKSDSDKLVCKKQEEVGSRLGGKKVCMTKKQWDEQSRLSREDTERLQQNSASPTSG